MIKKNQLNLGLALLVATVMAAGSVPALAHGANSGSGSSGGVSTLATTSATGSGEVEATETETSEVSTTPELHKRGDNLIAEMKKKQSEAKPPKAAKTSDQRKKACEAHKQGLDNKFSHMVTNSQKIQTHIDKIYAKALAYQVSSNAQPAGFADLVTVADNAKENASTSIEALKAITPTTDCNNVSVASDIATFKAAAQQTRDNLKAYRTAVKAVLKSLVTTKNVDKTAEGSN